MPTAETYVIVNSLALGLVNLPRLGNVNMGAAKIVSEKMC